jgi:hypothetical protein
MRPMCQLAAASVVAAGVSLLLQGCAGCQDTTPTTTPDDLTQIRAVPGQPLSHHAVPFRPGRPFPFGHHDAALRGGYDAGDAGLPPDAF